MSKVYRRGDRGDPHIAKIQRALNELLNIRLVCDADFGKKSEDALKLWQEKNGCEANGIYSGRAQALINAYIDRRYITEKDFVDSAEKLQCEVAAVKAVQEVESRGAGFLPDGKPIILYERHIFRRLLNVKIDSSEDFARELCHKLGFPIKFSDPAIPLVKELLLRRYSDIYYSSTGGYVGGTAEWDRLNKAKIIDEECAIQSASWGLFQIMGFHFKTLGFNSPKDMVVSYSESERNQMLSFCDFIISDKRLIKAIRAKDWPSFAFAYNGSGYAVNKYDVKMEKAYNKYKA